MTSLNANDARKRFGRFPRGTWQSSLGGGHDMHTGVSITFHDDGTGTLELWGFDQLYDPAYVGDPVFHWRPMGDRLIEITHRGEARMVNYDFTLAENEYEMKKLRMIEPALRPNEYGEIGFWISPYSLVLRDQNPGVLRKLCKWVRSIRSK